MGAILGRPRRTFLPLFFQANRMRILPRNRRRVFVFLPSSTKSCCIRFSSSSFDAPANSWFQVPLARARHALPFIHRASPPLLPSRKSMTIIPLPFSPPSPPLSSAPPARQANPHRSGPAKRRPCTSEACMSESGALGSLPPALAGVLADIPFALLLCSHCLRKGQARSGDATGLIASAASAPRLAAMQHTHMHTRTCTRAHAPAAHLCGPLRPRELAPAVLLAPRHLAARSLAPAQRGGQGGRRCSAGRRNIATHCRFSAILSSQL